MLDFPFYSFGFIGIFIIFVGLIAFSSSIYRMLIKESGQEEKDSLRNALSLLVGSIFILVGALFSIGNYRSTYNFRNIDISKVRAFKVIKSEDEYNRNNSNFVIYDDTQSVQNILRSLKNCYEISRNHESFQDGYKFQIIFDDKSSVGDFYISAYRKSNNREGKTVVIPHYYGSKSINLGEYGCPTFQNWIKENIDPIFLNKK